MAPQDITAAAKAARRGLKRDVQALCAALDQGSLFLPLAKALRSKAGEYTTAVEESISLHMMTAKDGSRFGAAFTRDEFLSQCGSRMRWKTDDGPLSYAELQAKTALNILWELARNRKIQGVVLNAMQPEEIILQPQETAKLSRGESFPMPRYIGNLPVQPGERFTEGDPAPPPPRELTAALDALVGSEGFARYRLRQTFNAERDIEPHLLLHVFTPLPIERHAELAQRINQAMKGKIPPPGYLDVLFVPSS